MDNEFWSLFMLHWIAERQTVICPRLFYIFALAYVPVSHTKTKLLSVGGTISCCYILLGVNVRYNIICTNLYTLLNYDLELHSLVQGVT